MAAEDRPGETGQAHYRVVSADYFRALGIPLISGRSFSAADDSTAPHVTVVNEALAREMWPGGSAMGKRIRFRGMDQHNETWLTVIGVVRDAKQIALDAPPVPEVYVSYRQRPERAGAMSVVVRTRGAPQSLAGALAVSRVLRGLVYGVGVTDPVSFGAATATLAVVALVASWIPARRASRVDPIVALRAD
jgi:hypothetical protein